MKKKVMEWILQRIMKNAERGAGLPSDWGIYESPVPEKLRIREESKAWKNS